MPKNMGTENEAKTITLSNNTMTFVLVGLLVVASFAIGMLWTRVQNLEGTGSAGNNAQVGANPAGAPDTRSVKVEGVTEADHVKGNRDAKIALIEYSDFECPFCARFHPTAQQVVDEYDGEVMWVYRHFPLTQLHPKAQKYAEATECAAAQERDKFWEMGDAIFEQTPELDELGDIAAELGLNVSEFESCLDSDEMAEIVAAHTATGRAAGVTGTPGNVILNTETGEAELVSGAVPFTTLQNVIDGMLEN